MYEVMARRYRPALFEEVVGQEHIAATLKNAITRDRVAHAYLFTGGHGCGKTTMARILAKALVCEKGPTPEPCCVCPICVDVAAGRDSDVLEIDGASNNGIEQIRQLREQAAYVPTRARFKIYIIDEVHMLSEPAFNALLKTLEEPPRHVKFILATTDPHKIPDTILSRCQRFDFRLVPQAKLAAFFRKLAGQEHAAISDDALEAVAAFAEGSVRDGLVLLDQLLSFADGEVTRGDVESVRGAAAAESVAGVYAAIAGGDVTRALAIVDEVASRGTNVGDFLDQLIAFGRDLMVLVASGNRETITAYGPAREILFGLAEGTELESALLYLDIFTQARTRVRSRALSNPLVALEMAVARLSGLPGVTPVASILKQLAGLPAGSLPAPAHMPAPAPIAPPRVEEKREPEPEPLPEPRAEAAPEPPPPAPTPEPEPEKAEAPPPEPEPAPQPATPTTPDAVWSRLLDTVMERHPNDMQHLLNLNLKEVNGDVLVLAGSPLAVEAWEDRFRSGRLHESVAAVMGAPAQIRFVTEATSPRSSAPSAPSTRHESGDANNTDHKRDDDVPPAAAPEDEPPPVSRVTTARERNALSRHPAVDRVRTLFDGVMVNCVAHAAPPPEALPQDEDFGDDDSTYEENA